MKKNTKFLVGGLVAAAVVVAAYFGNAGGLFQGKISLNKPVTRVELMKLLSVVLAEEKGDDLSTYTCVPFSDEDSNAWYVNYVCYMYEKGFVKGKVDGTFGLKEGVTRAEAAKLFFGVFSVTQVGGLPSFADYLYQDVPPEAWYHDYINALAPYGILDIKPGKLENLNSPEKQPKFYPDKSLTKGRAQYWTENLKKALNK